MDRLNASCIDKTADPRTKNVDFSNDSFPAVKEESGDLEDSKLEIKEETMRESILDTPHFKTDVVNGVDHIFIKEEPQSLESECATLESSLEPPHYKLSFIKSEVTLTSGFQEDTLTKVGGYEESHSIHHGMSSEDAHHKPILRPCSVILEDCVKQWQRNFKTKLTLPQRLSPMPQTSRSPKHHRSRGGLERLTQFVCDCGKTCSTYSNLISHQRTHTDEDNPVLLMTVPERVYTVTCRLKGMKNNQVRASFEKKFKRAGPMDKTIRELVNKFMRTGSVHDEKRCGRPRKHGEKIGSIRHVFREDPRLSVRKASKVLQVPYTTLYKILHRM